MCKGEAGGTQGLQATGREEEGLTRFLFPVANLILTPWL
jgi:hypothetical protein